MHGNSGHRIKHLRGTTGCPHYREYAATSDSTTKCATNGCDGKGTRACHVVSANQNGDSGRRYIIYCCPSCNAQIGSAMNVRLNALKYNLPHCTCGDV